MAPKRQDEPKNAAMLKALEEMLNSGAPDEARVRHIQQPLELHLSGTTIYIPSYTKSWMEKANRGPIMNLTIQTDAKTFTVSFWSNPTAAGQSTRLRATESMGAANFAFSLPLKLMRLKFPRARRIILPLHKAELPTGGATFWVSFAELAHEARHMDKEFLAAARALKREEQQVRMPKSAKD